jgi:hypothetical protein
VDTTTTREVRERIRRNVGRLQAPVLLFQGRPDAGRLHTAFDGTNLISVGLAPLPGQPPGSAPGDQTIRGGRTLALSLATLGATRELAVSGTLPSPSVLRQLAISGSWTIDLSVSIRVLLTDDIDLANAQFPTGTDIIEFAGDPVTTEDPGVHIGATNGALTVEPWRRILSAGQRLKLKVHNNTGTAVVCTVFADFDDLI